MTTTRTLGDLSTSAIGCGAMVLSPSVYGDVDDDRGRRALRHALDEGATLIDGSDSRGCSTRMNMSCPFPAAAPRHTSPRTSPLRR